MEILNRILLGLVAMLACMGADAAPLRLRVGVYDNPPKIAWSDRGRAAGIFPALLERIAARNGWAIDYVPCAWEA